MWKWFKHLFVHEWEIECEYVSARRFSNGMFSTYNKIMVCKNCGKIKHYHFRIRDISMVPKAVAVNMMREDVEKLKQMGLLTKEIGCCPLKNVNITETTYNLLLNKQAEFKSSEPRIESLVEKAIELGLPKINPTDTEYDVDSAEFKEFVKGL